MKNPVVVDHPLVRHHLGQLRDASTPSQEFRRLIDRLTALLVFEATRDLAEKPVSVQTPICTMEGRRLSDRIGLVPILRAGLGMVGAVLEQLPEAEVWHLGIYRDEESLQPMLYYKKMPPDRPVDVGLVVDPMLATGGSAVTALDALAAWGVPRTKVLSLIAAPEGLDHVRDRHPETTVYVGEVDRKLNEKGFIVPGLGDAGDRTFNAITC